MKSETRRRTIEVVVDEALIEATEERARAHGVTRSELIQEALRIYVNKSRRNALEELDRDGYVQFPDIEDDLQGWEEEAAWPTN